MGLLDRFRKKESVHFERDASGRVVDTERTYEGRGSRTPVSDALLRQQRDEKRRERQARREEYRQAYQDAFKKARLKREAERGRSAGGTTWSDRLDNFTRTPPPSRRPATSYRIRNNYNPFADVFDTGMNYNRPRKKSSSKTKYKVIGGKAYPIAGTGKKKSKKKSSSRRNDWDVFNAFGGGGFKW